MNDLTELLLEMLDLYILYKFMYVFFDTRSVNRYVEATAYFFKFFVLAIVKLVAFYPLANLSATIICYFLVSLCYSSSISKKILVTFIAYICEVISEAIGAVIMGITNFSLIEKSISIDGIMTLMIEIINWLIILGIGIFKNVKREIHIPKRFMLISILVQVLSIIMSISVFAQNTLDTYSATFALWMVIVSNFLIIYLYDSLLKIFDEKIQIESMRREKLYYHNQSELLQANQKNLQQFRHDIRNRMYALREMMKQKRYKEAEQYIEQIAGKLENVKMYSQTGNIAVDSIINYKLTEAEEQKVEIYFSIILPEDINIQDDDMVVVIGNLLDNAIEAAKDAEDKKKLMVHIEYDRGFMFIHMKNTYSHNIREKEGRLMTNKSDKELHGIGLQSVDTVIKKYNGVKNIDYDDIEFSVDIILPIA